jgi:hypothetical protein
MLPCIRSIIYAGLAPGLRKIDPHRHAASRASCRDLNLACDHPSKRCSGVTWAPVDRESYRATNVAVYYCIIYGMSWFRACARLIHTGMLLAKASYGPNLAQITSSAAGRYCGPH